MPPTIDVGLNLAWSVTMVRDQCESDASGVRLDTDTKDDVVCVAVYGQESRQKWFPA
jgi:hypothetical protein